MNKMPLFYNWVLLVNSLQNKENQQNKPPQMNKN